MMSILGATPEDMEEVLKSLGYRHEALEAPAVAAKLAELDAFAEADAAKQAGEAVAEPAAEAAAEVVEQPATEEAPVAEAAAPEATAEAVAETSDAAAAEEPVKMVLLWRPGRHDNRPREQNRNRPRPQGNRRAPAKDGAPAGDAKDNAGDNQSREQSRDGRSKRFEKAARVDFRNGEQKSGRNEHQGKPRHAKRDHDRSGFTIR
uniref:Uncharacterized protein n=1 Tax=Panagrolaimus superbus TaxID=310955 RepID=A0A914ZAU8_9BILA